jgi:hypothetical protein
MNIKEAPTPLAESAFKKQMHQALLCVAAA